MYLSFLIHFSASGRLGCLPVLAILHSAVMNIGVHVFLSILNTLVFLQSFSLPFCRRDILRYNVETAQHSSGDTQEIQSFYSLSPCLFAGGTSSDTMLKQPNTAQETHRRYNVESVQQVIFLSECF